MQLEPQCHIEVLRHIRFGPDLLLSIRYIYEGSILEGFPAQETLLYQKGCSAIALDSRIMAYKWGYLSIRACCIDG